MRGLIALCVGFVLVLGNLVATPGTAAACTFCLQCGPAEVSVCFPDGSTEENAASEKFCNEVLCVGGEGDNEIEIDIGTPCSSPRCPTSEAGQCNDGVNNDAWLDDLTDGEDPDCTPSAPTASPYGIAALLIALGGFGAWRLRKRAGGLRGGDL